MPIYEYQCQACGHRLEKLQKMSDDPLKQCPECEADELKKLVSAAAFRLKGAGWYETDFKNGKKKNLHGVESSDKKASGETSAASNADSKPAANTKSTATASKPAPKKNTSKK